MSASAVAGPPVQCSSATELLSLAAADPSAPLCAGVGAPGGYGKTALLHELVGVYHRAGIAVATPWRSTDRHGEQMLLVDDAHLLDATRLDELRHHAERPDARMVVAYRPWPRPAALMRLVDVLRRTRPPVVLSGLTDDQIRVRLAATLQSPPPAELVDFVSAQTGRNPRYVARVAAALTAADAATQPRIPVAALAPFAADLDDVDSDLRTLLLAVEAGAGLSFDLIAALLERDSDTVADLVDAGRAAGLLAADGTLVPLARQAIAALGPIAQRIDVRQRLAALQLARGGPVLPLVRPLLRVADDRDGLTGGAAGVDLVTGTAGNGLGPVYEAAGEEALGNDPALAAQLFAAAAGAGRTTEARRALATALAGDLDLASKLADQSLAAGPPSQRSGAAYVAAVVLTHRGQLAQAVELYQWSQSPAAAGFGAVGLIGTGRLADARRLTDSAQQLARAAAEPPTSLSAAASLMARGVCESVTGSPAAALSTLVQASALIEPAGPAVLLPDSPAALGATLALQSAEFDTAEALLTRALRAGAGGALLAPRHRLLQAWVSMLRGRIADAEQQERAAGLPEAAVLHGRDLLFGAALRVALARRNSDLIGLRTTWPDACQVLIGQPVDLFALLPLGELTVAAARLGDEHRVAEPLAEADRLLDRLGNPPLWTVPLHWSRLHAAILAEDLTSAQRHASELGRHRGFSPYAAAVGAAAKAWLDVLTDQAEPESVVAAARGLAALGLTWDGTRLAGQAAIRTPDRKAMTVLLDCARALQGRPVESGNTASAAARRSRVAAGAGQSLSDREHEVATLVLAGLTYKQVADRLYISAKTVEHHMARIRQRLGCTDRRELLARLRAITDDSAKPGPGDGGRL
jgi:DNA-binding CsgD family transcriptional regulator/tetratricopeptide (TPR) repeat protein